MDYKLFTIIIPTHNRYQMLEESLQIAIPQVRRFKKDVSLYVSDNASSDDTQAVVEKYLQSNEDIISYFRQPENIGGQRNFRHAVKAVNSKYVCLIGDDDVLFPNYVETILSLLKEYKEIGVINYNVMSVSYEYKNAYLREKDIRGLSPVIYSTGKDFIYNHLEVPSLVSSNVFDRELFVREIDSISIGTYPGYDWLAVLYKSCLQKKCMFVNIPILMQRYPLEQRWISDAPWFYVYGLGRLFKDLDIEIPGLYNHWIKQFQESNKGVFKTILPIVSRNQSIYKERYETMRPYMCSKEYEKQFRLRLYHSDTYIDFVNSPAWFLYVRTSCAIKRVLNLFRK